MIASVSTFTASGVKGVKMGRSMKQMMIIAGDVFFAISLLCLIAGESAVIEKNKLEEKIRTKK